MRSLIRLPENQIYPNQLTPKACRSRAIINRHLSISSDCDGTKPGSDIMQCFDTVLESLPHAIPPEGRRMVWRNVKQNRRPQQREEKQRTQATDRRQQLSERTCRGRASAVWSLPGFHLGYCQQKTRKL